ncbi:hypothetical protein AB0F17_34370 [Nonomuraea sp. NPDC026600]|uniref:hypothetical protein n=1 Tax=Nonomuraea sp. NPDC026600 TaxID=3155363 RepID=UPI0033E1CE7D
MTDREYADDTEREHASRLAQARHAIAVEHPLSGLPPWSELAEQERLEAAATAALYLRAGRRAGLFPFDADEPVMLSVKQPSGEAMSRDDFEAFLRRMMGDQRGERLPVLDYDETHVVASLLDELAARFAGERLGWLAREMAVQMYDRIGL